MAAPQSASKQEHGQEKTLRRRIAYARHHVLWFSARRI
jgi:hypothetical protein